MSRWDGIILMMDDQLRRDQAQEQLEARLLIRRALNRRHYRKGVVYAASRMIVARTPVHVIDEVLKAARITCLDLSPASGGDLHASHIVALYMQLPCALHYPETSTARTTA